MRTWLPMVSVSDTMISFFDGDAEGWLVFIQWRRIVISFEIARMVDGR